MNNLVNLRLLTNWYSVKITSMHILLRKTNIDLFRLNEIAPAYEWKQEIHNTISAISLKNLSHQIQMAEKALNNILNQNMS